ncbi:methyltransferase domain-containing protein [Acuticoccus sp. MNP-M23]|uniref:class I SAM-dependent methyltransferase n=1 Tax=Acuticoccus sp. MNP-M23 TaxID=3072793 RepID=UPI002815DF03|nr:methyltransferase domain-containing protein [Acuticoccus sp. MNP-M23]WMS41882.1 methyltransferase domain-containing protein [Acuticoccus sp. MNP-M23]
MTQTRLNDSFPVLDRPPAERTGTPATVYSAATIALLELCWGAGWLSPGGSEDVADLLRGQDLRNLSVLDIGVGAGGPAIALLTDFGARRVTGIDVEQPVLDRAAALAQAHGVAAALDLRRVSPGPLPFVDGAFDAVFSKDSFIHIADKARLFAEIRRVLRPGALCAFGDWCCGPPPYSDAMTAWLGNGMGFATTTINEMRAELARAGFEAIEAQDCNRRFAAIAAEEAEALAGPRRAEIVGRIGHDAAERLIATARRRALIAIEGHLRPAHFIAKAPA